MKFDGKSILLDKVLNDLDLFVIDFVKILEKHTPYVIVSGYVAILLGRSRATEDVDVFITPFDKSKFMPLYKELKKNGYWCLNAEDADEVYSYLAEGLAIRFARTGRTVPNFEIKFPKKMLDFEVFTDFIKVVTKKWIIKVSSLERQIAFKKYHLKSDKDLEDAKHLEEVFRENINFNKIEEYKKMIEDEDKNEIPKAGKG